MNTNKISASIDKVANTLELKGLAKLASALDEVANTVDAAVLAPPQMEGEKTIITEKNRMLIEDFLHDAILTLSNTVAGDNPVVKKLNHYWQVDVKDSFTKHMLPPEVILANPNVVNFVKWAHGKSGLIPDNMFFQGTNSHKSTWSMLGDMFDILKEGEFATKGKPKGESLEDFARKELTKNPEGISTRTKFPGEDALFKTAALHSVPRKYQNIIGLIYGLKRQDSRANTPRTQSYDRRAD